MILLRWLRASPIFIHLTRCVASIVSTMILPVCSTTDKQTSASLRVIALTMRSWSVDLRYGLLSPANGVRAGLMRRLFSLFGKIIRDILFAD